MQGSQKCVFVPDRPNHFLDAGVTSPQPRGMPPAGKLLCDILAMNACGFPHKRAFGSRAKSALMRDEADRETQFRKLLGDMCHIGEQKPQSRSLLNLIDHDFQQGLLRLWRTKCVGREWRWLARLHRLRIPISRAGVNPGLPHPSPRKEDSDECRAEKKKSGQPSFPSSPSFSKSIRKPFLTDGRDRTRPVLRCSGRQALQSLVRARW